MPSTKRSWYFIIVLGTSTRISEQFCNPIISFQSNNRIKSAESNVIPLLFGKCSDCCEYCNTTDVNALVELPSFPIHTSRRRFVEYTAAALAGVTGFTSTPATAETFSNANPILASDKKNILVPGPLPPFSTTRTYRNIMLGNGLKVVLVKDDLVTRSSVALTIDDAGQFAEPPAIPGLAHLMEHIVLSSTRRNGKSKVLDRKARRIWNRNGGKTDSISSSDEEDFEEWIAFNDGDSNAFTAPGFVCFHFNGPHEVRLFVTWLLHHTLTALLTI